MNYPHILSPIQVGGRTLKSRLLSAKCLPTGMNDFDQATAYYENFARKGAATVTIAAGAYPDCDGHISHMAHIKMEDPGVEDKFRAMIDRVHQYGTLCSVSMMSVEPQDVAISDTPNWNDIPKTGDYSRNFSNKPGITLARLERMIDNFVGQCVKFQKVGFDMATFYVSYRGAILACSLSPVLNQRTDKYGGKTMAERAALTLEIFRRVKEACGPDFLIECQISATEEAPGYTVEDWLDYCQLASQYVDIFQVRGWDGSFTHCNGYNTEKGNPYTLQFAEAFKQRGIPALVSPVGGFTNPDDIEKFLAEGKTDLVSMARGFISNEDFGDILQTGRSEDLIPCLLCNGCHGGTCAVNPEAGFMDRLDEIRTTPTRSKKVAVLGGGAAGLRAAILAARQGHAVTLYEKSGQLGGQLLAATKPAFKWPLNDYKNWLLRQVEAAGVTILLNTPATPEVVAAGQYDAIFCAFGSAAKNIPVPGAETAILAEDALLHPEKVGPRVVVVGGQATGRETALYLAQNGHTVTLLTRGEANLFDDLHAKRACEIQYETNPNFSCLEFATTREIGPGYVVCDVQEGIIKGEDNFGGGHNGPVGGYLGENDPEPGKPGGPAPEGPGGSEGPGTPEGPGGPPPFQISPARAVNVSTWQGRTPDAPDTEDASMEFFMEMRSLDFSHATIRTVRLNCDSVVVSGGRQARLDAVAAYQPLAPQVYVLGDNDHPGDIKNTTHSAYAAVMAL
jgi:2,4-dienoyl-CoA reductase-like NADH-dependent reductase (Old Yellow Enzyme family)